MRRCEVKNAASVMVAAAESGAVGESAAASVLPWEWTLGLHLGKELW